MNTSDLDNTLRSLKFSLEAGRRSSHTVRQYSDATRAFALWCTEAVPKGKFPDDVTRHHVNQWLAELQQTCAPATVRHKYSGLKAFFNWYEEDAQKKWVNPMAKMKAPEVPETQKDIVPAAKMNEILKALDACKRRREAAMVSLFYDCGLRASELCGIRKDDVDWDECSITLADTKNHDTRQVPFGPSTAKRLDSWRRARKDKDSQWLFTGTKGQLTRSGILQIIKKTFAEYGVEGIGPHDLRHTFATHYLDDPNAREGDLQTIAGWRSPEMARRYSRSGQNRRAVAAHKRLSPVEKLR